MRATDRAARPDPVGDGLGLGPRGHRRDPRAVGALGSGPPRSLPATPRPWPTPWWPCVACPVGTHLTMIEVQPEAPVVDQRGTHDHQRRATGAAAGLGRRGRARPSGRAATDPIALIERVRAECGDVGQFRSGRPGRRAADAGPRPTRWFFRAPEELLDQAEAYPFMTPIFGEGVVFDAPPERRREMLHNQALRDKFMRGHASTIADRGGRHGGAAGATTGTIDLLDWFAELTIYTSSACLIGKRFRGPARPAVRPALPRPRTGHRRPGLRRPLRPHRELPPPRRVAGRAGGAGPGDHGPAVGRPGRRPTTSATSSTS